MTNREEINAMSDKKLAELFYEMLHAGDGPCDLCPADLVCERQRHCAEMRGEYFDWDCRRVIAAWLSAEAESRA